MYVVYNTYVCMYLYICKYVLLLYKTLEEGYGNYRKSSDLFLKYIYMLRITTVQLITKFTKTLVFFCVPPYISNITCMLFLRSMGIRASSSLCR